MHVEETPIWKAVAPLATEARKHAETKAQGTIDRVLADLEANNWDIYACCGRALSGMSRERYSEVRGSQALYATITTYPKDGKSRRPSDPWTVVRSPESESKFIQQAGDAAVFDHDKFVLKLIKKVGEHSSAVLEGSHIWGYSFLTVETPEGEKIWKTQTIYNISKLGKVFLQFPSRQVKHKR